MDRPYRRAALLAWAEAHAYRADALGTAVLFWAPVALSALLWSAAEAAGARGMHGYTFPQLVTYFALTVLMGAPDAYGGGGVDRRVSHEIATGEVRRYLIQPLHPAAFRLAHAAAGRAAKVAQALPAALLLALLLQRDLVLPGVRHALLFAAAAVLGFALEFLIQFLIGLTAFWLGETVIFGIAGQVLALLGGALFPLDLLPRWAAGALRWLPFPYTVFFPLETFLGRVPPEQAAWGLALQVGWLAVLAALTSLVWARGVARYEAYGG